MNTQLDRFDRQLNHPQIVWIDRQIDRFDRQKESKSLRERDREVDRQIAYVEQLEVPEQRPKWASGGSCSRVMGRQGFRREAPKTQILRTPQASTTRKPIVLRFLIMIFFSEICPENEGSRMLMQGLQGALGFRVCSQGAGSGDQSVRFQVEVVGLPVCGDPGVGVGIGFQVVGFAV